jgi:O-acetyl-ADP-ribose deacetylase (regulator of RNase III)
MRVELFHGDITTLEVDAIVNAANRELVGGGGVDGAIWQAAGHDDMMRACNPLGGCEVGHAKSTPGFNLPARWVIHTVGPVWVGGGHMRREHEWRHGLVEDLANCYRSSLAEAVRLGARSIAFPAISTGVFRFPADRAAQVAVRELRESTADLDVAILVAYDTKTLALYNRELSYVAA